MNSLTLLVVDKDARKHVSSAQRVQGRKLGNGLCLYYVNSAVASALPDPGKNDNQPRTMCHRKNMRK